MQTQGEHAKSAEKRPDPDSGVDYIILDIFPRLQNGLSASKTVAVSLELYQITMTIS